MELWDAYNKKGEVVAGQTLVRGKPIPHGYYHLVVTVLVRHADGSYLLMQRDPRKPGFPGWWEASAGGAAQKGEAPDDAARRELKEETGITPDSFVAVGKAIDPRTRGIYAEYIAVTSCDKNAITLQEGETVAYRWVDRDVLLAEDGKTVVPLRLRELTEDF